MPLSRGQGAVAASWYAGSNDICIPTVFLSHLSRNNMPHLIDYERYVQLVWIAESLKFNECGSPNIPNAFKLPVLEPNGYSQNFINFDFLNRAVD